jgi:hypothetical protein
MSFDPSLQVAWSQAILKGDTLRAMWFYQRTPVRSGPCLSEGP